MDAFYICIAKYPRLGFGAFDPEDFDGAVDHYADFRDDITHTYYPAWVYRCDPKAGAMEDVTDAANKELAKRYDERNVDYPDWLMDEVA